MAVVFTFHTFHMPNISLHGREERREYLPPFLSPNVLNINSSKKTLNLRCINLVGHLLYDFIF